MLKRTNVKTRDCRNSRLHKCLRLAERHDHDPAQGEQTRAIHVEANGNDTIAAEPKRRIFQEQAILVTRARFSSREAGAWRATLMGCKRPISLAFSSGRWDLRSTPRMQAVPSMQEPLSLKPTHDQYFHRLAAAASSTTATAPTMSESSTALMRPGQLTAGLETSGHRDGP